MRRYWYRRILIMCLVLAVSLGSGYFLIEYYQGALEQEVNAEASGELLIPGGMPIGIYLETEGVLVLGTDKVKGVDGMEYNPAAHLVKAGDYIEQVNGQGIHDKEELIRVLNSMDDASEDQDVVLSVRRGEQTIDIAVKPVKQKKKGYKLGIWVRDNAQGLGTVTFLNKDSEFGALGHGIHDVDTSQLLQISDGLLYTTSIKDIQKGENGVPGGMEGIIVYNNYNILGDIEKNTENGIFGKIERTDTLFSNQTAMETAQLSEIVKGDAIIKCSVDGSTKEYNIQITDVNMYAKEDNKKLEIEITDEELLAQTGGIVQGMSGSPIIQNGKIVGAVTHVFVQNPRKGYGIFIEDMLKIIE